MFIINGMNPPDEKARGLLRLIPQVNELAEFAGTISTGSGLPRQVLLAAARNVVEEVRASILSGAGDAPSPAELEMSALAAEVERQARSALEPSLRKVINATGVVLQTTIGRAAICREALHAALEASAGYCNLEFRIDSGERGSRQEHLEPLLCALTGAEAAVAVNNNAAAVLLVLAALARGREVIVSRGQLVEIGDSFRLPEIMAQGGAQLVEVGTTNRTCLSDYSNAIGPETALLMKIHQSNFRIVGYTEEVGLGELVGLGRQHFIPVVEDLGSGSLVGLDYAGLTGEHTAAQSIAQGADLVTFSGDKLLGGPQAGLIVGAREYVDEVRRHPLARAVRIDKMTVAALEATLRAYLDTESAWDEIPCLRMLSESPDSVRARAARLKRLLDRRRPPGLQYEVVKDISRAGGGSLPTVEIPTYCLRISHVTLSGPVLETALRSGEPPVLARVKDDHVLLDLRTVAADEVPLVAGLVAAIS